MATIVTRSGKGSPLTNAEVDGNFTNLNTELGTKANTSSLATVATTGAYSDLTGKPTNVSSFTNDSSYITSSALTGYLTSSTAASTYQPLDGDLTAIAALAGTTGLIRKTAANTYSLDTATYLTSFTESDPTVPSHVKAITTTNISNWNTAFGWGNHASAGYLTSITSGNVTTALGYTPANKAGDTFTGTVNVSNANVAVNAGYGLAFVGDQNRIITPDDNVYGALIKWGATGGCRFFESTTERMRIDGTGSVTANVDIRAPIFYDSNDTNRFFDPASTSVLTTVEAYGSGFRSLVNGSASISSQIYFANAANSRAWNWQLDENNNAALWGYNGSAWAKRMGVTNDSELFLRNSSGSDVSLAYASTFGYSSAYKTMVLGNQSLTTVCIGVSPASNPSGSFNGGGLGLEVMFRNGVNFITPNSANNGYHFPLSLADGYVASAGSFRAPIFYDTQDTANYIDPNSVSNIWRLTASGRSMVGSAQISMSGLDANTYYPVTIPIPVARQVTLRIENGLNSNVPSWSTHPSGFSCYFEWTTNGLGWGTIGLSRRVTDWREQFTSVQIVGGVDQMTFSSQEVIWLRGGANYFLSADCDVTPTIRTTSYDAYGQVVAPRSTVFNDPWETAVGKMSYGTFQANVRVTAGTDMRAPVFYDSNNTGYYVDPASTSALNIVTTSGYIQTYSGGVKWDESGTRSWSMYPSGGAIFLNSGDGAGSFNLGASGGVRAPIFYDSNNTGYYLDPNSSSRTGMINADNLQTQNNVYLDQQYGSSLVGAYNSVRYQGVYAMGDAYKLAIDGTTAGSLYGIAWAHPNAGGVAANLNTHGALFLENGGFLAAVSGSIRCRDDMRAPVYYDSNNTAFGIDASGTSTLNRILARQSGVSLASGNSSQLEINNAASGACNISFHREGAYGAHFGLDTDNVFKTYGWSAGGGFTAMEVGNLTANGIATATSDFRAPIFYDSANTAYYVDPNGNSSLNGDLFLPNYSNIRFNGTSYAAGVPTIEGGGPNDGFYFYPTGSTHGIEFFIGGTLCMAYTAFRAPIFHDSANTAFYLDPNATGTSLNVAGSIVAAGNVTAYSDIRIKANVETIPDALDKLDQIRGVTYTRTDLDDKEQRYAGVIAQEIEKVLPEAVRDLGNIKAVDYNATIGLLIQAVKELRDELETVKSRLH